MTKDEALKLALDALKSVADHRPNEETNAAIAAIKQALEQPSVSVEQEPVAWAKAGADWLLGLPDTPLEYPYFTNGVFKANCQELAELLQSITSPPKREPLTGEQIVQAFLERPMPQRYSDTFMEGVRFAEAAHGIGEKK